MSEFLLSLNRLQKSVWNFWGKLFLTLAALTYVAHRLWIEKEAFQWEIATQAWEYLLLSIALLPFNLGLEARKWQILQQKIDKSFSFAHAIKGVCIGIGIGIFTPNRVGEYMGRLMSVKPQDRWQAVTFTLINRLSQMLITLSLGLVAWIVAASLSESLPSQSWISLIPYLSGSLLLILLSAFLLRKSLQNFLGPRLSAFSGIEKIFQALGHLDQQLLWKVWSLSLLRYTVFSLQYILVLYACGATGSLASMVLLVILVFLIKSLAPFASIAELGIREAAAVMVGGWLGIAGIVATASAFSLDVINLVLPAALGWWMLHREKS